jgi:hypothetical protein
VGSLSSGTNIDDARLRIDPMAIGASGPAPGSITVLPTVKTRKKVPINSTKYSLIIEGI